MSKVSYQVMEWILEVFVDVYHCDLVLITDVLYCYFFRDLVRLYDVGDYLICGDVRFELYLSENLVSLWEQVWFFQGFQSLIRLSSYCRLPFEVFVVVLTACW